MVNLTLSCPGLPKPDANSDSIPALPPGFSTQCNIELEFANVNLTTASYANFGLGYRSVMADQYSSIDRGMRVSNPYFDIQFPNQTQGELKGQNIVTITDVSFKVDNNHIGVYSLGSGLSVFDMENQEYCPYIPIQYDGAVVAKQIVVLNNPSSADILFPYVYNIHTEKPSYKIGETVRTYAYIVDKSELILNDAWTQWYLNGNRSLPAFSCPGAHWNKTNEKDIILDNEILLKPYNTDYSSIAMNSNNDAKTFGWYYTDCTPSNPGQLRPGIYHLMLLNIFDQYGNGGDSSKYWQQNVVVELL